MQESTIELCDAGQSMAQLIGWAVRSMSRYTPWESLCLAQALTAKIMLKRRRIPNTIYLGAARDNEAGLLAHAWVRCGKEIITGGQGHEKFTVVAQFANKYNVS